VNDLDLVWRKPEADDLAYIERCWLAAHLTSDECSRIDRDVYYALYRPAVNELLSRCVVDVACDPTVPTAVLGWMATGEGLLHYVHVRPRWRKLGVATWMLRERRASSGAYTHNGRVPASALLGPGWRYEPWRRLQEKHHGHVEDSAQGRR
jgi:GNAT superfamily N-acetyltransferase